MEGARCQAHPPRPLIGICLPVDSGLYRYVYGHKKKRNKQTVGKKTNIQQKQKKTTAKQNQRHNEGEKNEDS